MKEDDDAHKLGNTSKLIELIAKLQQQRNQDRQEITSLQQQRNQDRQEITSLQQQRNQDRQEITSLQQQRNQDSQKITSLQQQRNQDSQKITSLQQQRNQDSQEITSLQQQLQAAQDEISALSHKLANALRQLFGQTSEKNIANEPEDDSNDICPTDEQVMQIEQADSDITVAQHTMKKPGRKPLPDIIPRDNILHDLTNAEKVCSCGHDLHQIDQEVYEQLYYIPATVKVIKHIKLKYACRHCEQVVTAKMPKQPIAKSIATPSLLAHTLISKFDRHLPLYRQEQIWQDIGVDIPRCTLANWVIRCSELLLPIYQLIKERLLAAQYLQADETTMQVHNEQGKSHSSNSYIWVYSSLSSPNYNNTCVLFEYQPTRGGYHASEFLANFSGYLQTDGYSGYNQLKSHDNITPVSCWAHTRRKFVEVCTTDKKNSKAQLVVKLIAKLYKTEQQLKGLPYEQATIHRQKNSQPILDKLKSLFAQWQHDVLPKGPLGKAIYYAQSRWDELTTYVQHGFLHIDTNHIENKIRPIALGRKNYLFCHSPKGAKAAAIIYTIITNAKLHNLKAYDYLQYILTKIPNCDTLQEIEKLLPWNVKPPDLQP